MRPVNWSAEERYLKKTPLRAELEIASRCQKTQDAEQRV
ncbi:hypothetical protein KR51_00000980 [Rubidibacter lacunae KORDI 51-2]|uniref:Uncharacterized protein n=1 Tax=Rubidibacter lacunae KORDI 51-2 TaxID=582515 RepID=U5DNF7_9CHRO|nr:hypothetical protein KR51_00000980 [Rubidibacter lacunae KORDI 51-2]